MGRHRSGWIKSYRAKYSNGVTSNGYQYLIFDWLIHHANHSESQIIFNGEKTTLKPGDLICSMQEIAEFWQLSKGTVFKHVRQLENHERIRVRRSSRGTLVSICNWSKYQGTENDEDESVNEVVNGARTQRERSVNLNKELRKKEVNTYAFDLERLFKEYPKRRNTNKARGLKTFQRIIKSDKTYAEVLKAIQNYASYVKETKAQEQHIKAFSTFSNCWEEWVEYKSNQQPQFERDYEKGELREIG